MIELRWLKKDEDPYLEKVLQYRQLEYVCYGGDCNTGHLIEGMDWSEWEDVPTVEEE